MDEYVQQMKQAVPTNLYRDMLILRLRDLTDLYSGLLSNYAKIVMNDELFNTLLSELLVTTAHVYHKLLGSGDKAKELLKKFEPFLPWLDDITIPKTDVEEQKKVHELFRLILNAYDFLGLSNY